MLGPQVDAIEAVLDIVFGHVDGSVAGVGMSNFGEKAVEGAAKLHGFGGSDRKGVLIYAPGLVVGNETGASFSLFFDLSGGETQPGEMSDFVVG